MSPRLCANGLPRAENVAHALRLRATGLTAREIADRLGVKRSTAAAWLNDPDLSMQAERRARYAGTCVDCGANTDGSNGAARAARRCASCAAAYNHEHAYWTDERVLEAARDWFRRYGRAPRAEDWPRVTRLGRAVFPAASMCYSRGARYTLRPWPSWVSFLRAAGLEVADLGRYERAGTVGLQAPSRELLERVAAIGGITVPALARDRGVTTQAAGRMVKNLVRRGLLRPNGRVKLARTGPGAVLYVTQPQTNPSRVQNGHTKN